MWNFRDDYSFWVDNEWKIVEYLRKLWYEVETNHETSIHDWKITNNWRAVHIELKSRRCARDAYKDTLIWANKLGEAWNKYYSKWEETLFFFSYTDWLFYINPLDYLPRRDYVLQRWDRWDFDKAKWWIYFDTKDLKNIY